ncbi:MAG: cytochrome c3 family protein [Planctomycetes bacterium]|nr:cytochrome c3 family protein [Planctomycetota bacterium]
MDPHSRLLAALGASAVLSLALAAGCSAPVRSVVQPVAFDHRLHVEQDMACLDCHVHAADRPQATLPGLTGCMLCHAEPQGEGGRDAALREYAERGEPVPWVQVNQVVGHVYFTHAVHVTLAELECSECHGDMTRSTEPPTTSQVEWLTMGACMDCHFERNASNDCNACHK